MIREEKIIIGLFLFLMLSLTLLIGSINHYTLQRNDAFKMVMEGEVRCSEEKLQYLYIIERQSKVERVWRAWDKDNYADLYKIGNRWLLATNLNTDLSKVYAILDSLERDSIDIMFSMNTLWRESRIGANIKHKPNYDGSIDGGWWGLNSKYHPLMTLGDPIKDYALYKNYFNINIRPYEKREWYYRYVYGYKKAKQLGLI